MDNNTIKCSKAIVSLINQIPTVTYGSNMIPYLNIEGYGIGDQAFNAFVGDFNKLKLETVVENANLLVTRNGLIKEISDLENKLASLTTIFGENGEANQGSLAYSLLQKLEREIDELKEKRDSLKEKSDKEDIDYANKLEDIDKKTKAALTASNKSITDAQNEANSKVRLIEQFSDFLSETNSNMTLYATVIIIIVIAVGTAVAYSIPDLLNSFAKYNEYVKGLNVSKSSMPVLNYAFGILIIKLPWAICLSAVFTGMYSLLKGLLSTYEKINQDKRNMSAIYSISGNVAESLNSYGLSIVSELENPETGEVSYFVRTSKKEIDRNKENLKWNQIMNYFERMQNHKEEVVKEEDSSQLKFTTDILNKVLDKIPTVK